MLRAESGLILECSLSFRVLFLSVWSSVVFMTPGHRRLGISVSPSHSYLYNISAHTLLSIFFMMMMIVMIEQLSLQHPFQCWSAQHHREIVVMASHAHIPHHHEFLDPFPQGSPANQTHPAWVWSNLPFWSNPPPVRHLPFQQSIKPTPRPSIKLPINQVDHHHHNGDDAAGWQGGNHTAKPLITICLCHHWCTRPRKKKTKCGSSDGKKLCREILMGLGIGVLETSQKQ